MKHVFVNQTFRKPMKGDWLFHIEFSILPWTSKRLNLTPSKLNFDLSFIRDDGEYVCIFIQNIVTSVQALWMGLIGFLQDVWLRNIHTKYMHCVQSPGQLIIETVTVRHTQTHKLGIPRGYSTIYCRKDINFNFLGFFFHPQSHRTQHAFDEKQRSFFSF